MGDQSKIEWTDATWNFIVGCTQVSDGCDNCYAMTMHNKRHKAWAGGTFPDAPKQYHKPFSEVQIIPERLEMPLRWTKPRKIFVNSLADLFHKDVPDDVIDEAFVVMSLSQRHTFQILTKRPQRMLRYLGDPAVSERIHKRRDGYIFGLAPRYSKAHDQERSNIWKRERRGDQTFSWPLPNVWIGTSVENQEAAYRIDYLVRTPGAVRFLSCEPLIGELDLCHWIKPLPCPDGCGCCWEFDADRKECACGGPCCSGHDWPIPSGLIDWVIVGGESGTGHRPIDPNWVRSLRDQCTDAGVSFLFKQWGGHTSKAGGRDLDGRTWDEYPEVAVS